MKSEVLDVLICEISLDVFLRNLRNLWFLLTKPRLNSEP